MSINSFFGQHLISNSKEGYTRQYVCLDVYIQPCSTHRTIELGWVPLIRVKNQRHSDVMDTSTEAGHAEQPLIVESCHVLPEVRKLCESLHLQPGTLGVAAAIQEPTQAVHLQQELSLGPLIAASKTIIPCGLSQTDGSVRCQLRVFTLPLDVPEIFSVPLKTSACDILGETAIDSPTSLNFHSTEEVVKMLRPSLVDQQSITRQRIKGVTDRSRLCKELRNAVPTHLKKRKNRRAVIKTLQDLEEYMGSIDPVFEVCGNNAELCMTAARTIGLSNTRFIELRRMWEAYQEEKKAENHEVLELSTQKDGCTLRKLVAILERYGWSCTSAQPRANEDISRPPRAPTTVECPNWVGSLRKRPSFSTLSALSESEDYESDFSPKRPRSECCSSEEGNTSDEGDQFPAAELLLPTMFEAKFTQEPTMFEAKFAQEPTNFIEDSFFLPTWTPRSSNSSDAPNIVLDVPDVELFNEIEKQLLAEFL